MKMDAQDKYTQRPSVPLTPVVVDLVEQAAEAAGLNRGQWLREATHEKLARDTGIDVDALDTARRPARRRANQRRQQAGTRTEGQQS